MNDEKEYFEDILFSENELYLLKSCMRIIKKIHRETIIIQMSDNFQKTFDSICDKLGVERD